MNRLKEMREDRDLIQNDIAKVIGVSRRTYGYYEEEYTPIPQDILHKLADYYNTSTDYILYRTDIRKQPKKSLMYNQEKSKEK